MIKKFFYSALFILVMLTSLSAETNSLAEFDYIFDHLLQYPDMEASDLYKLVYQATSGPAHYGADREKIMRYLEWEVRNLPSESDTSMKLIEPVGGQFVRVYLGPYIQNNYSLTLLADCFIESMKEKNGTNSFESQWRRLIEYSRIKPLGKVETRDLLRLDSLTSSSSYPPVHHSDTYKILYTPHYRVLSASQASDLMNRVRNN